MTLVHGLRRTILAAPPATCTYITSGSATNSNNPSTFAGVTLGTAYTHIIVALASPTGNSADYSHTALTVDGTSATKLVDAHCSAVNVSLWIVAKSVASGDLVYTASGAINQWKAYATYGVNNLLSTTPLSTGSNTSTGASVSIDLATTSTSGFIIAAGNLWITVTSRTYTGDFTTKDVDMNIQGGGAYFTALHGTPVASSVTLGHGVSTTANAACSAALR